MALTATATPRVRADILQQLGMTGQTKWFLSSFNRTNLQVDIITELVPTFCLKVATTPVDFLISELMLHLSHVKQVN